MTSPKRDVPVLETYATESPSANDTDLSCDCRAPNDLSPQHSMLPKHHLRFQNATSLGPLCRAAIPCVD